MSGSASRRRYSKYTSLGAVFSSNGDVTPNSMRYRVPGAIDAGTDYSTPKNFWFQRPTDIAEDFEVNDFTDVVVPSGATHLAFTTWDTFFSENRSDDLRVAIHVLD